MPPVSTNDIWLRVPTFPSDGDLFLWEEAGDSK